MDKNALGQRARVARPGAILFLGGFDYGQQESKVCFLKQINMPQKTKKGDLNLNI